MPFDWNNFLTLAEDLAKRQEDASKRTAISRAYYCVFNFAFARAMSTGCHYPGEEGRHQWCWRQYSQSQDRSCAKLGANGDRMKRLRVKVDYEAADIPRLDERTSRMLKDAQQFLAALAALNPRYPLP
jgi:uncharacterized protein (UPF0332 family)